MNENAKRVVKMIIYYVIACYEKQDMQQCRRQSIYNMIWFQMEEKMNI